MNPYIRPMQPMQDVSGLQPVFQNFAQQQANQAAALAQQNQLMSQTGQSQGGMNPMALAMMLRKKDPTKSAPITDYSEMMPNYLDPAYQQAGY